jgi:hypothetical protein
MECDKKKFSVITQEPKKTLGFFHDMSLTYRADNPLLLRRSQQAANPQTKEKYGSQSPEEKPAEQRATEDPDFSFDDIFEDSDSEDSDLLKKSIIATPGTKARENYAPVSLTVSVTGPAPGTPQPIASAKQSIRVADKGTVVPKIGFQP